ncbi:MAG: DUF302 domain-containing protein [Longimicrobiales bacterium]
MSSELKYGFKKVLNASVEDAEAKVREALAAEGFGVLTEIDIKAAFKSKLDVDFRPYRILGACSPPLAHRALLEEDDIGLLLPCNVVVYEGSEPDTSVVSILDPVQQLAVAGRDDLGPMADEVQARLKRVMEAV